MRRPALVLAAVAALATSASALAARSGTNLSVVGYSIPTTVFPKLEAAYGNGVSFSNSFAASEVQSKAVAAGLPADVVNFSITTDVDRLPPAELGQQNTAPHK